MQDPIYSVKIILAVLVVSSFYGPQHW